MLQLALGSGMPIGLLRPATFVAVLAWTQSVRDPFHDGLKAALGGPGDAEALDVALGGPGPTPSCEELINTLNQGVACTVDEFLNEAWMIGLELDCQLQRSQAVLALLTERFQQAALAASRNDLPGRPPPTADCMEYCPVECERCIGQRYFDVDGLRIFMVPQPKAFGTAYAYDGSAVKVLGSQADLTSVDVGRINRGLWYAAVLGRQVNFTETDKYYSSPGVQLRLHYRGNDPAIIMELDSLGVKANASAACVGVPNRNIIDRGNFKDFFDGRQDGICNCSCTNQTNQDGRCQDTCAKRSSHKRAYWQTGRQEKSVTASMVTLDEHGAPMGTVTLDVQIKALCKRLLTSSVFTEHTYALLVDKAGRIIALTERARKLIFHENMTETEVYNIDGLPRCKTRAVFEEMADCSWDAFKPINILIAANATLYSGANFSRVLRLMFEGRDTNCSWGMHEAEIEYPKLNTDAKSHLVAFCTLSSIPDWGLLVGTEYRDVTYAANMSIDQAKMVVNQSAESNAALQEIPNVIFPVTIENQGRIAFPFVVDDQVQFVEVHPTKGTIQPGEKAVVNFTLQSRAIKDFGVHSGHVLIRGNDKEPRGACFRETKTVLVQMDITERLGPIQTIMRQHGHWVLLALVALLLALLMKMLAKMARAHFENEAQELKIIEEALSSVHNLSHPMVLMSAQSFRRIGRLVSHEEAQSRHESIWLYSVQEVDEFCRERHIVFVSHQWTAFDSPDPTNIQYAAMVMSVETLQTQKRWKDEEVYVWVDYTSIPQKHSPTQTLAINSLTTYASHVAAFVVVAPPIMHKDLIELCNKDTYQRRAWCRAEQLAHILAVGSKNMYLAEGDVLTPLESIENWLEQSMYVFQGDLTCCRRRHDGMGKCDKELLVIPMLGLWAQLCQRCHSATSADDSLSEVHAMLSGRVDEVLPCTFAFRTPKGGTEQRVLFGKLLERLPHALENQRET